MGLFHASQTASSSLLARPISDLLSKRGMSRVANSGARWLPAVAPCGFLRTTDVATSGLHAKPNGSLCPGSVRLMGVGSHKEGNRAGQHGVRYPQAKPDGSPEKAESDERRQFLDKAKEESASRIDEAQELFLDSVESGKTIGEATTELQFGVKDGKNTDEAISNASKELFKQSTVNGKSGETIKEEDRRKYSQHGAEDSESEVSSEVWSSKDDKGTHSFLDNSNQVEFLGQEDESVLGIGGLKAGESHTDESSGPGETTRENIEKTRSEAKEEKARSPQAGVVVGNVPSAGANALENEGDIPQFSKEQEETGSETLKNAQKQYEQSISGFGTGGDKKLEE